MDANKPRNNHLEGDETVVSGFGRNQSLKIDDDFIQLEGPQATSTVATKKSRYELIQEYISSVDNGIVGEDLDDLTQVPFHQDASRNTLQPDIPSTRSEAKQLYSSDSVSLGSKTSLINVDAMSGLSDSKFLVDHTQLSQFHNDGRRASEDCPKFSARQVPSNDVLSDDEYDTECAIPKFTEQELENLENDLSENSDLSQGEDEECKVAGLGAKYLTPSPEVLRSARKSSGDFSHKLSSVCQPREIQFGECNTEDRGEGVPSYLLEAQESLLLEAQISRERSNGDGITELQRISHSKPSHHRDSMEFDVKQISARSTMFCDGLEESKLLSTSCNSLGSLGEAAGEDMEDDISAPPQGRDTALDVFGADQADLASLLYQESFHAANVDFLEEEEKEHIKLNLSYADSELEDSCFSGIYEVKEFTVRPSWIPSPDKDLLGPGNKIHIEDYLKRRSETLGSLGGDGDEGRPDFGFGNFHSPPGAAKRMPLVEMSSVTNNEHSYLQPVSGEPVEMEVASHENPNQKFHDSHREMASQHMQHSDVSSSSSEFYTSSSQSSTSSGHCSSSSGGPSSGSTTFEVSLRSDGSGAVPKSMLKNSYSSDLRPCVSEDEVGENVKCVEDAPKYSDDYLKNSLSTEKMPLQAKNTLGAEQIRRIISDAPNSENTHGLINEILQRKSKFYDTADISELDASTEVLELRAQREALMSKFKNRGQQQMIGKENKVQQQMIGKENRRQQVIGKETVIKSDSDWRQPRGAVDCQLQKPTARLDLSESGRPIHKQMERLKVLRTGSAPLNVTHDNDKDKNSILKSRTKEMGANLVELVMDESVRGIPYKSRILDDSHRSQLTSFHDSSNSGFDSSTPCAPRTRTKTNPQKLGQGNHPYVRAGNQIYVEDKRPGANTHAVQRLTPRMGLACGSRMVPTDRSQRSAANIEYNSEANRGSANIHSSRSETTVYPDSEEVSSYSFTDGDSLVRSSSMPSSLQALGVPGGLQHHAPSHGHHPQSLKKNHSQESLTPEKYHNIVAEDRIVIPQRLVFSNTCILGMGSEEVITFHNPKQRWVQVSIRLMQETINNTESMTSALLFKPSYFVEPRNAIEIKFGLCSQLAGSFLAVLEVRVSDLSKGFPETYSNSSIHTLVISAQIEEPCVQLSCEGKEEIDFGIVPESCITHCKVTMFNQSPRPLPVILTLQQVAATSPVFFWDDVEGPCKVVSPTRLAYEFPSGNLESGPIPQELKVFIKAPHLDEVRVDESGVYEVLSRLQVELDTPNQSSMIIASMIIRAYIGAVHLQSYSTLESHLMEARLTESSTTNVPFKNLSTFPLQLSIEPRDHKDLFTVHPNNIVIQPHSVASASVTFAPKGRMVDIQSVLLICIEPRGKEFEVPIAGKTIAPRTEMAPPSVPLQRTLSAPVPNQRPLASVLESTKSRLVFGTVAVGEQSWLKLVLRNTSVSQALRLNIGIQGSKDFKISELGSSEQVSKMDTVLEPCQEFSLSVYFSPTKVEALGATLICKIRGVADSLKFPIPVQGYGGQRKLHIPDSCDGSPLIIHDVTPHHPAIFHTALVNTGDREMFLKLQVFWDEKCTELIPTTHVSLQPDELLIKPKENRDVICIVNGTSPVLTRVPGCIGFLQIIHGDEILRRRFRRLKNKEVKARRLNDASLLKIDWNVYYNGEKEVNTEEISLPLQPEDATVFYNNCSKVQIQLNGEPQVNDDPSSTVFACLDAEYTANSTAYLSVAPDRTAEVNSPLGHSSLGSPVSPSQLKASIVQQPQSLSWDVFPATISIPATDTSSHIFFVVNFTDKQQMLEVSSDLKWLRVDPTEALLPSRSSVRLTVGLIQSRISQPIVSPVTEKLQIMCENESRSAVVTITPVGNGANSGTSSSSSPLVTVIAATPEEKPHVSKMKTHTPASSHPSLSVNASVDKKTHDTMADTFQTKESGNPQRVLPANTSTSSNVTPSVNNSSACVKQQTAAEECPIEVVTKNVLYPDTPKSKEAVMKVKIRNFDSIIHLVKVEVSRIPFAVRHHELKIKPGHYMNIPVYFRPQKAGVFTGHLNLIVVKEKMRLTVQLAGKAL